MMSDIYYSLEWMKKARRSGNCRGVERVAAYHRERVYSRVILNVFPKYKIC